MPAYKDKDRGTWYVKISYQDYDGETKKKFKRGFATKREASEWEADFKSKMSGNNTDLLMTTLCDLYLEDKKCRIKPTTYANQTNYINNNIKPFFRHKLAVSVGTADIRRWQNDLINKGYAKTSLRNFHACLVAVFSFGMKYYGLKNNPATDAGSIGTLHAEKDLCFWTQGQYLEFRSTIKHKHDLVLYDTLYYSGMRIGEALALKDDDLDFKNNSIRIDENYVYIARKGYAFQSPKTKRSKRTILMPEFVMEEIKELLSMYYERESSRVFPQQDKNAILRKFKRQQAKLDLPEITLHDLRHSHASMLIDMNSPITLVSARLGHDNTTTTLKTYAHLFPTRESELIEKIVSGYQKGITELENKNHKA